MKWIGQHIWDQISRFRSDVYLEDISSGTIASGGYLGLDSNNKIVKSSETGDITAVTITTDSGGGSAASDTGGSADFSILGSSGVGVTNSGATITAVAVPGEIDHDSLLNFVAAEHYDWSDNMSATATIDTRNITDLHGAGVDGGANSGTVGGGATQLLTDRGNGAIESEAYASFVNNSNTSTLQLLSNQDTGDLFSIGTTTHGATTITTNDDDSNAANLTFSVDGTIYNKSNTGYNQFYKSGNDDDFLRLSIGSNGDATFATTDAAGAAANINFAADGYVDIQAAGTYAATTDHQGVRITNEDTVVASDATTKPRFIVKNTTDDASSPRIILMKRREDGSGNLQAGEDGDGCGLITFNNYDDNSPTPGGKIYSTIETFVHDATNNEESGQLKLGVSAHDGGIEDGIILTGGSVDAEVDVTIGNGAASVVSIPGHIDLAGDIDVDGTLEADAITVNGTALTSVCSPVAGHTSIATVGTIADGVWQGGVIASAYLDADTAHLSGTQTFTGAKTFTGDITATSSSEGSPILTLKTTHTTKTKSAELQFLKDAADTEDGENLGIITFYGEDEGNSNTKFAHIKGAIAESDHAAEGGKVTIAVASHDGEMINGLVINDGDAEDEIDVTIGSTTSSLTTVAGNLTISGDTLSFASSIGRRATFELAGYAVTDGTNYMMADIMSGNKAPFLHDETSIGANGTTADNPAAFLRAAGTVMPYNGTLKIWKGWGASNGSSSVDVGIFKYTPTADDATNASLVLVKNTQFTAAGNDNLKTWSETSFSVTVAAGDILITAIKGGASSKTAYFTSTIEIEWTS